ncbi:MAG: hypothetical protein Q9187_007543 [Circinaria calcarea]
MPPKSSTKAVRGDLPIKRQRKKGDKKSAQLAASKRPKSVPTRISARVRGLAPEPLQEIEVERELPVGRTQEAENTCSTRPRESKTKQRSQASALAQPSGPEILPQLSNKIGRKPRSTPATHEATTSNVDPVESTRIAARVPTQSERIENWAGQASPGLPPEHPTSNSTPHPQLAPIIREHYKSRGYVAPSPEEMGSTADDRTITASQAGQNGDRQKKQKYRFKSGDPEFEAVLAEHNVNYWPTADSKIVAWKRLVESNPRSGTENDSDTSNDETGALDEVRWQIDIETCIGSNEAMFQRTTMMTILNRHELDDKLTYVCEAPWKSDRFPCKDCKPGLCKVSQPQPDLVVAFKPTRLMPEGKRAPDFSRLRSQTNHIFPEGEGVQKSKRAFPFFAMEVKGRRGTLDNAVAEAQNLNTASQGLYNIYRCMQDTDNTEEFFEDVRIFSAVATTEGFWLRAHRPVLLAKDQCNKEDYPIGFDFDEVVTIRGKYTRAEANRIVYNVLFHYGVKKLFPILKRTVQDLFQQNPGPGSRSNPYSVGSRAASQAPARKRNVEEMGGSFDSLSSTQRPRVDSLNVEDSQN